MSILTPSSLEKQYPNTGKNTVEISDSELQKQYEQNDKVQSQLTFDKTIEKNIQDQEAKMLKQKLLGIESAEINIANIDLQVFNKSLFKILSTHFKDNGNAIKFQNN